MNDGDEVLWYVRASDVSDINLVEIEWSEGEDGGHLLVEREHLTTEVAIRADERARVEGEIVESLRMTLHRDGFINFDDLDAIEAGAARAKGEP